MRILLTRPEHDAKRTAEKLDALGHDVLCVPILTVKSTVMPAPTGNYDIVLVTSANGAARLAALPGWRERVVYAVGRHTGAAIRAQGAVPHLRIAAGDAASMVALIKAAHQPDARIVHVTGVNHKAEPDASLRAAGFTVFTWSAYNAVAAEILPEAIAMALTAGSLDAALHFSRRSVEVLLRLVEAWGLQEAFCRLSHFCLSEDVATPLRLAGARTIAVSEHPSEQALLERLETAPG